MAHSIVSPRNILQRLFLLFVVILSVAGFGCKNNPATPPPADDLTKVMPLHLGNTWVYRRIYSTCTREDTTVDTSRILDTTLINGIKCFIVSHHPVSLWGGDDNVFESIDANEYQLHYCIDCLGNKSGNRIPSSSLQGLEPLHLLQAPLQVGRTWDVRDGDSLTRAQWGKMRIDSLEARVETPAGIFQHVIIVSWEDPYSTLEIAIAPGIGIVRVLDSWAFAATFYELTSYELH